MPSYNSYIDLLMDLRKLVDSPNTDVIWSSYNTTEEAILEIDSCIQLLKQNDPSAVQLLELFFAPAGPFQEISISSGWGDTFLALAATFDRLARNQ